MSSWVFPVIGTPINGGSTLTSGRITAFPHLGDHVTT
jgi:hypothetical protein